MTSEPHSARRFVERLEQLRSPVELAKACPAFRAYEVSSGGVWAKVDAGIPGRRDRIRVVNPEP
jgi:hypothetical protein